MNAVGRPMVAVPTPGLPSLAQQVGAIIAIES